MVQIEVKKGKNPKLTPPRFVCDAILKPNVPPPYHLLVDSFKFILWVGRPKSGKTSHLFSLFKDKRMLRKTWHNVIVCMPKQSLRSIKESDNIFKDINADKYYPDLDDIDVVKEQVQFYAEKGENSVIIIDDLMSSLKEPNIAKVLTDIVSNRRHLRCSIILCTQIYERVPLRIRKLINVVIVMHRPSKREIQMIFEELLEQKEVVANEIYNLAFKEMFNFLMIDVPTQHIYANYDEIILHP